MLTGKSFEQHAKLVLGDSKEGQQKVRVILQIEAQLQQKLMDVMSMAQDGDEVSEKTFNDFFGGPLLQLNDLLTDEEFSKIFSFNKSEFQEMLETPFKTLLPGSSEI